MKEEEKEMLHPGEELRSAQINGEHAAESARHGMV